jgi:hypothetical protein
METPELALTIGAWKIGRGRRVLPYLSVGLILALSVAPLRAGAQEIKTPPNPPQPAVKVIILPPQVAFEQLTAYYRGHNFGGVSFEPALANAANANLTSRQYTVVTPESLQDTNAIDWLKQLQPLTSRLSRGVINDEAQQIFSHLGTLPENYLIFIQFMRVKEGPGGSWDPNTGAITSQMSSTLLQAALISTRTGQVLWKNDVLERSVFRADSPKFAKSVDLLYSTLSTKGGN